jgi:serralysin
MKKHPKMSPRRIVCVNLVTILSLATIGQLLFCQVACSATYHVSTSGSDSQSGLTPKKAFRTIQRAADAATTPGDVVLVANGEYAAFRVNHSGSPKAFIRFAAQNRRGVKITGQDSQDAIRIAADFIEIDGFEVTAGEHGINGESRHHLRIVNNHAHNCGKSGISLGHNPNDPWYPSDYYWVEDNLCHNNARKDWYSGISVYEAIEYTPAPGEPAPWPGPRIVIRNNICHSNFTFSGRHTDGNGIIIDDFNFTQNAALLAMDGTPYSYGALVENNLCYNNGGAGIKVVWSDNVVVRNNTVYGNNLDKQDTGTYRGGLYVQDSRGCIFINNISWGDRSVNPNNSAIMDRGRPSGNVTTSNLWINNLTWMGTAGDNGIDTGDGNNSVFTSNILATDPQFENVAGRDFRLKLTSPALNIGAQTERIK